MSFEPRAIFFLWATSTMVVFSGGACGGGASEKETTSSADDGSTGQETEEDQSDNALTTDDLADSDDSTSGSTENGDPQPLDLDACLQADENVDLDQPLNTIDAAQKENLCTWYQAAWECVMDKEAMCKSEGLSAGAKVFSETDDGAAACQTAQQECLNTEPQLLTTLKSCLEVDVMTRCEGSLADYLLCLRATFTPLEQVSYTEYTCENLADYVEQNDQEVVVSQECEAFTATCDFGSAE